jgi:hypothetical protein
VRLIIPALVLLAVCAASGTALASSRSAAVTKARKAADHYTSTHYGIGAGWRSWSATCRIRGTGWKCTVKMSGGQCKGTLKLTHALNPYGHKIGCLERR